MAVKPLEIWTIGHSTRSPEEFISLLEAEEIRAVADVRQFPGSRRYPHFGREALAPALSGAGIEYCPFPELGGRRRPRADSPNTAWRNESFRGYADYMMSEPFQQGVQRLLELAGRKGTAIMCAEAVWWRCHRGLISDYLKASGHKVVHILAQNQRHEHPFTSAARIIGGKLSYRTEDRGNPRPRRRGSGNLECGGHRPSKRVR